MQKIILDSFKIPVYSMVILIPRKEQRYSIKGPLSYVFLAFVS